MRRSAVVQAFLFATLTAKPQSKSKFPDNTRPRNIAAFSDDSTATSLTNKRNHC